MVATIAATTRQVRADAGWVGYSLRAWLGNVGIWFGGSALAALASLWLPWLHDSNRSRDGRWVLGGWDIIWSDHWPAATLVPLGYLLLLLGGWALMRRYLWGAALVTMTTTLLSTLALALTTTELKATLDVGLIIFIIASANMGLTAGLACALHVLARVLVVPIQQPQVARD